MAFFLSKKELKLELCCAAIAFAAVALVEYDTRLPDEYDAEMKSLTKLCQGKDTQKMPYNFLCLK